MYCNKCGNKISDSDIFCPKCGAKVADIEEKSTVETIKEEKTTNPEEKNVTKKKSKAGIIIAIILIILLVVGGTVAFIMIKNSPKNNEENSVAEVKQGDDGKTTKTEQTTNNTQVVGEQNVSFFNMKYEDELSDKEKTILNYFDNDYFLLSSYDYDSLQRNTKVYKNAKVHSGIEIIKVLKSTDTECEVVGLLFDPEDDGDGAMYTIGDKNQFKQKILLKFNQQDERFIVGDAISFYGNYEDTTSLDIDGVSTILPTINASRIIKLNYQSDNGHRFTLKDIEKVATYLFGNDIKVRDSVYGVDHYESQVWTYTVMLENQANTNFRTFNMGRDYGSIFYSMKDLNRDLGYTDKSISVGADFEHFIVSSYDSSVKQVYIEYYDKNYNKLWQRKFDLTNQYESYNSLVMSFDYTKDKMAVNVENDLYLINLENGEDVFKPILVGQATRVIMQDNGIVLLGTKSKDAVMKINYDGTIAQRHDIETNMKIYGAEVQYVDGKLVMKISGAVENGGKVTSYSQYGKKFIVMNEDGTIETVSSDNMVN